MSATSQSMIEDSGLSKPLSDRERRVSQRAFIVMATLVTIAVMLLGPSGVFGIYLKQLDVSGEQLGRLMASTIPFGVAGLLCAGLVVKIGRKRMTSWAIIPIGLLIIALLSLPQIKIHWGLPVMLTVAWGLLAVRKVAESIMEVPWFPMIQMITLRNRRGAFLGRMRMIWGLACVISLIIVGRLLGQEAKIYLLMILIGLAGLLYWLLLLPLHQIVEHRTTVRPKAVSWAEAWRVIPTSTLFVRGVAVDASLWFGASIFAVFQLYFLTKSLGWSDSAAIDMLWVSMLGLAVSNIFWGTVADRLGDRAVAQLAFLGLAACPLLWVAAGNNGSLATSMVVAGAFGLGVFKGGAMMSTTRVILNHIPERVSPVLLTMRKVCMTLTMAVAAGLGSLVLKWLDGWSVTVSDTWLILDAYKVLFLISAVLWLAMVWLCRKFPGVPGRTPWTVLAAMFNRPFQTVWMVSRIDSSLPEDGRLNLVHRLARTDSPLAFEGLVAGLRDASYDVRLASVNALASRADPQSCEALMEVLDLSELDIQPEAAWALGELGDSQAIPILMTTLGSGSELLRGRAARALGKLNAREAAPILQRMLAEDPDSFARRSAAIALSRLNIRESLESIFEQFRLAKTRLGQRELALALANLVHGGDLYYRIRLHDSQGMAAVLAEAIDESLAEHTKGKQAQQRFMTMLKALRQEDLEQIRFLANEAINKDILYRPVGKAGELADYLLASAPAEPWAEEHAALLIFLLLQEWQSH
ncbi:MAG: MFS transporter [Actinobacteria bacterium]|nr:MFS transporter [Actinomycetota bacterium]